MILFYSNIVFGFQLRISNKTGRAIEVILEDYQRLFLVDGQTKLVVQEDSISVSRCFDTIKVLFDSKLYSADIFSPCGSKDIVFERKDQALTMRINTWSSMVTMPLRSQ